MDFLTGADYLKFIKGGYRNLAARQDRVNALNVFPVPDGDTGSNMTLTMKAAVEEVERNPKATVGEIAQAVAKGSLMGARGNSGVILSQLFRGMAEELKGYEQIDAATFAEALREASRTAYKMVMKPVEGTILTVSKEAGNGAINAAKNGAEVLGVLQKTIEAANIALAKTPDQLPVLKKAGVVDAGGQGYIFFLEGGLHGILNEEIVLEDIVVRKQVDFELTEDLADITFPYDTELFIKGQVPIEAVRETLGTMGDSVIVVGSDDLTKVHVHTDKPGDVLSYLIGFGELTNIEILNMKDQHAALSHESVQEEEEKELGMVAVAMGEGFEEIFRSLGIDRIVHGGQTMNPSTQDIVDAIESVLAPAVVLLPNNSNVILACEQAKGLTEKQVFVVPTKSMPEGIAAAIGLTDTGEIEERVEAMKESVALVTTGEITYAVRDTEFDNLEIKAGEYLGVANGTIVTTGTDLTSIAVELVGKMSTDASEILSLYYGSDVTEEDAEELATVIEENYPDFDVQVYYGGQEHYYYVLSLE